MVRSFALIYFDPSGVKCCAKGNNVLDTKTSFDAGMGSSLCIEPEQMHHCVVAIANESFKLGIF